MTFEEAARIITDGGLTHLNVLDAMAAVSNSDVIIPAELARKSGQPEGTTWRQYAQHVRAQSRRSSGMSGQDGIRWLGAMGGVVGAIVIVGVVVGLGLTVLPKELLGPALVVLIGVIVFGRMAARR